MGNGQSANGEGPARRMAVVIVEVPDNTPAMIYLDPVYFKAGVKQLLARAAAVHRFTGGQTVKSIGDGLLAAFDSPALAFAFAASLLQSLAQKPIAVGHGGEVPIEARVVVHVGDVHLGRASYGKELYGEPVLVAARLIEAVSPGEVAVSAEAAAALHDEQRPGLGEASVAELKRIGPTRFYRFNPLQEVAVGEPR